MENPSALNAAFVAGDTAGVLIEALRQESAGHVLDIGCGRGDLAARLLAAGFTVTGVEPDEDNLAQARRRASQAQFLSGRAEQLPVETGVFDAAIFLNSLHHVPADALADALRESRRAVRPGGAVLIVEPLAEGGYFEVIRIVDDETECRAAAARAIADAVREGSFQLRGNVVFKRGETVKGIDEVIARILAADASREAMVHSQREALEHALARHGRKTQGAVSLDQPLRCYWLRVPAEA